MSNWNLPPGCTLADIEDQCKGGTMRILIEVSSGCVTAVYCDDEDATVFIVDHDNLDDCLDIANDLDELTVDGGTEEIDEILYQFHRKETEDEALEDAIRRTNVD